MRKFNDYPAREYIKKLMEMEENLEQSIKYIVYLTINKVNKKIYVGVHKTINNQ